MERVNPDFSVSVNLGGESVLINRLYDNVHLYDWLGHSILKIVNDEGFLQWHTTMQAGLAVAELAQIVPVYRQEMTQTEYEQYLLYQDKFALEQFEQEFGNGQDTDISTTD